MPIGGVLIFFILEYQKYPMKRTHYVSRQLTEVITCVSQKPYISKAAIIDYLHDKDINVSDRTLSRYFNHIETDFHIKITYCTTHRGYYIDEDESFENRSLTQYLDVLALTDVLAKGIQQQQHLQHVAFEDADRFKGVTHLDFFIKAINEQQQVTFRYFKYDSQTSSNRVFTPFLLKEYQNRWYVIGVIEPKADQKAEVRTFGLDRINSLEVIGKATFKRGDFESHLKLFDHVVGISLGDRKTPIMKPQVVTLKITELRKYYLESLPLHHSQRVSDSPDDDEWYTVNLKVSLNYEFVAQLMAMGDSVQVIAPQALRKKLKDALSNALKAYK